MKYFYIDDVYFSAESISVSPVKVIHISCQLLACVCSCKYMFHENYDTHRSAHKHKSSIPQQTILLPTQKILVSMSLDTNWLLLLYKILLHMQKQIKL